jgi:hypothetical protein
MIAAAILSKVGQSSSSIKENGNGNSIVSISLIIVVIVSIIAGIAMNTDVINKFMSKNSSNITSSNIIITIELADTQTKHDVKIDLLKYSIASTTEEFCKQRYNEGVVNNAQDLAINCVPIIQNFLIDKLTNDFKIDPTTIVMGKYSDEILSYHTPATSTSTTSAVSTDNTDTTEKKTMTVQIQFNDVGYSLDLTEPIVLFTSSEAFCRYISDITKVEESEKLSFLGECVIPVAEKVMEQLITNYKYPESNIQRGEFSQELRSWAELKVKERKTDESKKITIPIKWPDNDVPYSIDLVEPIMLYPAAESFCRYMLSELKVVDTDYFAFLNRCLEPVVEHLMYQLVNTHNIAKEGIFNGDFSNELKQFYDENIKIQQQQQQQQQQPQEQEQQEQQQQQQQQEQQEQQASEATP